MKTATPPKGVTARFVSRRITRSPESRAAISRGTVLSGVFASTSLLSQAFSRFARPNLGIQDKSGENRGDSAFAGASGVGKRRDKTSEVPDSSVDCDAGCPTGPAEAECEFAAAQRIPCSRCARMCTPNKAALALKFYHKRSGSPPKNPLTVAAK